MLRIVGGELMATSKGRKAIHPPASGPKSRSLEMGCSKRDVELSGSLLRCGV